MDMALYTIYKGAPRHCGKGLILHGKILHGKILYGKILYGKILHGKILHGKILHGESLIPAEPNFYMAKFSTYRNLLG